MQDNPAQQATERQFLQCPNCGMDLFYIREGFEGLTAVRVTINRVVVTRENPEVAYLVLPDAILHCSQCTWNGLAEEVV